MLGLIKHLGASVFRVRSHCLKEITYREKQWGNISHFGATTFQICATSGLREDGWVRLKAPMRGAPDFCDHMSCATHVTSDGSGGNVSAVASEHISPQ